MLNIDISKTGEKYVVKIDCDENLHSVEFYEQCGAGGDETDNVWVDGVNINIQHNDGTINLLDTEGKFSTM